MNAACPAPSERQEFVVAVAAVFQRWYRRVDKADVVLLRHLAEELGVADAVTQPELVVDESQPRSEWDALDGKKVALYSLQESALRRAALVVRELCPGARVSTFHDHVGGSPALRTASTRTYWPLTYRTSTYSVSSYRVSPIATVPTNVTVGRAGCHLW